jgi:fermentation-respiration switch protein FrsA (DUF1100 family)
MLVRWFEYSQVYCPTRAWEATPDAQSLKFENLSLPVAKDDHISAWFLPSSSTTVSKVFLVCHGNGGNISHRLDLAKTLVDSGMAVLLFDYRGYGKSTGRPSEQKSYEDAQAAYRWLREKGFPPDAVVAYGESLGGGVAAELALREKLGGLVLQSTFTSIPDLGAELFPYLPVHLLATIKYDTRKKLPLIHVPVLVMHSRSDTLVSFHHAEANFAAANEPKQFVEISGDHNDGPYANPPLFAGGIKKFTTLLR